MRERTGKIIDKSVMLAGGVLLLANQSKTPDWWSTYLASHTWMHYSLIVLVGFFGAVTPGEAVANRARTDQRLKLQRRLLAALGGLISLADGVGGPKIEIGDVGLHTWIVKRTWGHPLGRVLKRKGTYRIGGSLLTVGHFSPTKGKGVVGLCWKFNRERHMDVAQLATTLTTAALFDSYRQAHGGDAVMNFTWEEFEQVKHRGAVFAAPVRNGDRFVGCISVDYSHGYSELVSAGLVQQLNAVAQAFDRRDLEIL